VKKRFNLPLIVVLLGMILLTVYGQGQRSNPDGKQHVWIDNILFAKATSQSWKYKVVVVVRSRSNTAWYENDRRLPKEKEPASEFFKVAELGDQLWELERVSRQAIDREKR